MDAVSNMLYYRDGLSENKHSVEFLQYINQSLHEEYPDVMLIAEDSSAWPLVTKYQADGGLGFDFKWNMGWMNDTLKYMEQIMPMLTKAGYVRSYRGNNGGYMLAKEPEEYTAGDIIRTTEGSLAPIACLDDVPNRCERQDQCSTLEFWEGLKKVIDQYVDSVTLADLVNNHEEKCGKLDL